MWCVRLYQCLPVRKQHGETLGETEMVVWSHIMSAILKVATAGKTQNI